MEEKTEKTGALRRQVQKLVYVEKLICSFLLLIMVAITFVQVFMRFVFNSPFSWSEEVTLILLVWFGYLCMPVEIFSDSHAALYFLYNKLPAAARKAADLGRHALLTWLFSQMIVYGMQITKLNIPKLQPATRLSQGLLFAPLVVGGVLMLGYCILNFADALLKPMEEYRREASAERDITQLSRERGGTE